MRGWGMGDVRALAKAAGVSHGTVANWLTGKSRARREEVDKVAAVFGWSFDELYNGRPSIDVMDRYAKLDAFRETVHRLAERASGAMGEFPDEARPDSTTETVNAQRRA